MNGTTGMIRKIAVALAFAGSLATIGAPQAAPVVTNSNAVKAAASGSLTEVRWGWWVPGAAIAGFALGSALAAPYYGGCGWHGCGYPAYGYPAYGYPAYGYGGPVWGGGPYWGRYPGYWGWRRAYWHYWGPYRSYW
jgi:hypothetical protein